VAWNSQFRKHCSQKLTPILSVTWAPISVGRLLIDWGFVPRGDGRGPALSNYLSSRPWLVAAGNAVPAAMHSPPGRNQGPPGGAHRLPWKPLPYLRQPIVTARTMRTVLVCTPRFRQAKYSGGFPLTLRTASRTCDVENSRQSQASARPNATSEVFLTRRAVMSAATDSICTAAASDKPTELPYDVCFGSVRILRLLTLRLLRAPVADFTLQKQLAPDGSNLQETALGRPGCRSCTDHSFWRHPEAPVRRCWETSRDRQLGGSSTADA